MTQLRVLKTRVLAALAYPLCFLVLYFTLVAHLRIGLGRWPLHINDNPANALFRVHMAVAAFLCGFGMLLAPISGCLAAILACVPRARSTALCLAIFCAGCLIAFGAIFLAPGSFVIWWWD